MIASRSSFSSGGRKPICKSRSRSATRFSSSGISSSRHRGDFHVARAGEFAVVVELLAGGFSSVQCAAIASRWTCSRMISLARFRFSKRGRISDFAFEFARNVRVSVRLRKLKSMDDVAAALSSRRRCAGDRRASYSSAKPWSRREWPWCCRSGARISPRDRRYRRTSVRR